MFITDQSERQIEEEYAEGEDEGDEDKASVSGAAIPETRQDFNSIMDEFLDGYSMEKKGRVKRGKFATGMDQLDEIRRGLGKARISTY
jgi:protein LTV1